MPTYTLTSTELARIQRKLQIGTNQDVFTDDELDDIFDESLGNFNLAMATAIEEILFDAAKLHNYSAGQTKENKSEIFEHLYKMREIYTSKSLAGNQLQIVGLRSVPPRRIARPMSPNQTTRPLSTNAGTVINESGDYGIELGPESDNV